MHFLHISHPPRMQENGNHETNCSLAPLTRFLTKQIYSLTSSELNQPTHDHRNQKIITLGIVSENTVLGTGFEPVHLSISELESLPLDHSGNQACGHSFIQKPLIIPMYRVTYTSMFIEEWIYHIGSSKNHKQPYTKPDTTQNKYNRRRTTRLILLQRTLWCILIIL
jgi:hypothetical protein